MFTLHNGISRGISLLLVSAILLGTVSPAGLVYAEDAATPPVVETVSEPTPPQESTPPVETTPDTNANPGEPGIPGENGQPSEDPAPEAGENGDDSTGTTPAEDGEGGESGNDGAIDPPAPDGDPTIITTGDASSDAGIGNTINTTDTTVTASTTPSAGGTGTSTQNCYPPPPPGYPHGCPPKKPRSKPNNDTNLQTENLTGLLNDATSTALTGENDAVDPDGTLVVTGDADAFGYLVSLFNIAITNSSGSILFLKNPLASSLDFTQRIMDVFANLSGSNGNGECSFLGCSMAGAMFNMLTGNVAEVVNTLIVRSGTGENTATSTDGLAAIDTGNANAFGSIVNFGNLQIIDSRYLVILMTNVGDLTGDIVLPSADFFKQLSSGAKIARGTSLAIENDAEIDNLATTTAGTGGNGALGEHASSVVSGNADVDSSTMNFVNQVGSPICFIVNVGDKWNGDVIGLPEGFTREQAPFGEIICGTGGGEGRESTIPGTLKATTTNYAKILNQAIVDAATGGNLAAGYDASIRTGNADAFLQILNVVNQSIIGQDWIFALFTVSGDWNGDLVFGSAPGDDDPMHEVASQLLAAGAVVSGGGSSGGYTSNPKFEITKVASVNSATTPVTVDYTVTLKNVGEGAAYRAKLTDVLQDPLGAVISNRVWDLDTIYQGETVKLTYTVQFNEGIPEGVYKNIAEINAFRNSSIYVHPESMKPGRAEAAVSISGVANQEAEVKPLLACKPLLTTYMRRGKANDRSDVRDLQMFLNVTEGEKLSVSGEYTVETEAAVKRFQAKYTGEVLGPWGIGLPTGNVYYTTQRKINDLACLGNETFTLSDSQLSEIDSFKKKFIGTPEVTDYGFGTVGKKVEQGNVFAKPQLVLPPLPTIVDEYVPQNTSQTDRPTQSSANRDAFSGIQNWLGLVLPFVEALEL